MIEGMIQLKVVRGFYIDSVIAITASLILSMAVSGSNIASASLLAEQTLIVDCLLPGKVRKLGISRSYISRKQPKKTSANDCEIRGGDYVQFDRATIASSLSVWQQAASQGDAKAQYFVGEIFEKGKGQTPDYESAVLWYRRAVKQDYAPAKMSLGRLYELGLGVEKDLVKAMNLYRDASGLNEDEIAYASVFEELRDGDRLRIETLKKEIIEQQKRSQSIERRSQVLGSDLSRAKRALKNLKSEIQQLQDELKSATQEKAELIKQKIDAKQAEVSGESQRAQDLEEQLSVANASLATANARLASLEPSGAPKVSLKWPAFEEDGEHQVSQVPAGSIVNVVGAIENFALVESFKINGKEYQLDANGLFLKSLDVGRDEVDLVFEIIDQSGQEIMTRVVVAPSNDLNVVLASNGSLTQPKLNFGRYHALVIGNNLYDLSKGWEPLDTAVNDATEVANVLENEYGFEVRLELNADRDTMLTALEEMRKTLTSKDNLLVYYAGHGLVDPANDQGYWVPVDGSASSAVRWISNASITDQIRAMTARNVMVIADSCYSSSLMRSGIVTLRSGLSAEKKALRLSDDVKLMTRVALSSGGLQPVIDSFDNSKHSVFANALLGILKGNSELLDADSLATQVAHSVAVATKDNVQQVPRYAPLAAGGHQGGEFYFAPKVLNKNR